MDPKDPRREPSSPTSSSASPSPQQSVSQLLMQLRLTIASWTTAIEAFRKELSERMAELTSVVSAQSVDIGLAVDQGKGNKAAIAGLRTLLADRNKLLGEQSRALVGATGRLEDITGSHALLAPEEPEAPKQVTRLWAPIERVAKTKDWRPIAWFLARFALKSLAASSLTQHILDWLLAFTWGRS